MVGEEGVLLWRSSPTKTQVQNLSHVGGEAQFIVHKTSYFSEFWATSGRPKTPHPCARTRGDHPSALKSPDQWLRLRHAPAQWPTEIPQWPITRCRVSTPIHNAPEALPVPARATRVTVSKNRLPKTPFRAPEITEKTQI